MKINYKILILSFLAFSVFAQKASIETESEAKSRNPVQFTHIPFLLLRFNPTQAFGLNNTIQYGVELAPPFGKFSFCFDYGKGKGSQNFTKYIKKNQAENQNKEIRGEIRMYFSDWYPFYALDKKPFGRYYAIEYVNGQYDRNVEMATGIGGTTLPSFAKFDNVSYTEKTQAINFKFGRHIHLHKHLFLDVYAGLGAGKYVVSDSGTNDLNTENMSVPLHFGFLSNQTLRPLNSDGFYFSKTAGVKIVVPL